MGSSRHRCAETAGLWEWDAYGEDGESHTVASGNQLRGNKNYNIALTPVLFLISRLRWKNATNASSSENFEEAKCHKEEKQTRFFVYFCTILSYILKHI